MFYSSTDMVVSGLPATNNNKHANIMARIALHLRECVGSFIIYHLPQTRLQLRIGIHSGNRVQNVMQNFHSSHIFHSGVMT